MAASAVALLAGACNKGGYNDNPAVEGQDKDSSSGNGYDEYGSSPDASGAAGAAVEADEVEAENYAFKPATIKVAAGTTVKFENEDNDKHSVTSGSPGSPDGKFDFDLAAKAEGSQKFDSAGTFKYFCKYHPNMTGTVEVS